MKSKKLIVYSLIGIVLFSIVIFIGFKLKDESNKKTSNFEKILEVNRKLEKENELSGGFPYTLEFLDYNITINSVKVFEDYALFDYSVKKIDGGYAFCVYHRPLKEVMLASNGTEDDIATMCLLRYLEKLSWILPFEQHFSNDDFNK